MQTDRTQRWLILRNPNSGSGYDAPSVADVANRAEQLGLQADVVSPPSPTESERLLRQALEEGYERFAILGGDGTSRSAIEVLQDAPVSVALLPAGTANNLARSLGIPTNWHEAMALLAEHDATTVPLSIGVVNDRYRFLEAAGVGLFASLLGWYRLNQTGTKDTLAAAKAFLQTVARPPRATIDLILDGQRYHEPVSWCFAANTPTHGPQFPTLAPAASPAEPEFTVVTMKPVSILRLGGALQAIVQNRFAELPEVTHRTARCVEIRSRRPLQLYADDQLIGTTPATIRLERSSFRVHVPHAPSLPKPEAALASQQ